MSNLKTNLEGGYQQCKSSSYTLVPFKLSLVPMIFDKKTNSSSSSYPSHSDHIGNNLADSLSKQNSLPIGDQHHYQPYQVHEIYSDQNMNGNFIPISEVDDSSPMLSNSPLLDLVPFSSPQYQHHNPQQNQNQNHNSNQNNNLNHNQNQNQSQQQGYGDLQQQQQQQTLYQQNISTRYIEPQHQLNFNSHFIDGPNIFQTITEHEKIDIDQKPQLTRMSTELSSTSNKKKKHLRDSSISTRSLDSLESLKISKPKIVTTYWEEEKTICYQVKAKGYLVSRREDNNLINGTKLLNVAGMSRGKRDGILKNEKVKKATVVKVGAMHLKGIWIPFERACEIARNEGVDELLHPLFVKDIKSFFKERGSKLKHNSDDEEEHELRKSNLMKISLSSPSSDDASDCTISSDSQTYKNSDTLDLLHDDIFKDQQHVKHENLLGLDAQDS